MPARPVWPGGAGRGLREDGEEGGGERGTGGRGPAPITDWCRLLLPGGNRPPTGLWVTGLQGRLGLGVNVATRAHQAGAGRRAGSTSGKPVPG